MARYYVAPGAPGIGGNSWASVGDLVSTVNHVVNNPSRGGDEIWARQGTYNLVGNPLVINQNREPLSIYGGFVGTETYLCQRNANINSVSTNFFQRPSILDGRNANRVIEMQQANVCRIDGFIIRNGNDGNGGGVYAQGFNIWFENIVFMDNVAGNDGGGMLAGVFSLMIKNTIFFNNRATNGGGLRVIDGTNTLLVNLLFNNNQTAGGTGNAIYIGDSNNVKIINNTIANNIGSTIGIPSVYCRNLPGVDIYNSIIYPDTLTAAGNANVTVDYCLLGSNPINIPPAPPITIQVPPNLPIGTNPNFVNPGLPLPAGDYHLRTVPAALRSPCIDAGNTNLIFPYSATDLEGNPRIINNSIGVANIEVDMGAFEVQ